jgi:hypothetical protein
MAFFGRKRRRICRTAVLFAGGTVMIIAVLSLHSSAATVDRTTAVALIGATIARQDTKEDVRDAQTIGEAVMIHASSIQTPESLRINASYEKSTIEMPFGLGEVNFVKTGL